MERKVDELGRVVLPSEFREQTGIRRGDRMDLSVENGAVVIRRVLRRCAFCGEAREQLLHRLGETDACTACVQKLNEGVSGQ